MAEKNTMLSIQVTKGQVFKSRNPDVLMISVRDDTSPNKFSTFPVAADKVTQAGDLRKVELDANKEYDISKPGPIDDQGRKTYVHTAVSGQQIMDMYEAARQKAVTAKQAQPEAKQSEDPSIRVHAKMIHDTNSSDFKRVSIRDSRSADGRGSFLIPSENISPAKNRSGILVPNRMDVDLGAEKDTLRYSIQGKDGAFIPVHITAGELKTMYDADQKAYMARQRQSVKEEPAVIEPVVSEPQASVSDGIDDEMAIE